VPACRPEGISWAPRASPIASFSVVIGGSGQRIPREIRHQYPKAAVGRQIRCIPHGNRQNSIVLQPEERMRPAGNVACLQPDAAQIERLGTCQFTGDPDTPQPMADKRILCIRRTRKRNIKGLDRTAASVEQSLDPCRGTPPGGSLDAIGGNPGARLDPAAKLLPGQNVANEDALGATFSGSPISM
jgi:hypothetical protein